MCCWNCGWFTCPSSKMGQWNWQINIMIGNRTFRCARVCVLNRVYTRCMRRRADRKGGENTNANHICKCNNHHSRLVCLSGLIAANTFLADAACLRVCVWCVSMTLIVMAVAAEAVVLAAVLPVHWDLFRLLLVMHRSVTIQFCQMAYWISITSGFPCE